MSREAERSSVFVPAILSVAPFASVQEEVFASTFSSEKFPLLTISSKTAPAGSAMFPFSSSAAFTAKDLPAPTVSAPSTPSDAFVSSVTVRQSCSGAQADSTMSESPFSTAISVATPSSVVAGSATLTTVVSPSASEPITSLPASTTEPRAKPESFPSSVTVSPLSVRSAPNSAVCAERSTRTFAASIVPSRVPLGLATSASRTSMLPPVATSAPPSSVSEPVWKFAVSSAASLPLTSIVPAAPAEAFFTEAAFAKVS